MEVLPADRIQKRAGRRPARLSVVVVDDELPFPTNSGKRIRTFNLLKHLAPAHEITYVARKNRDAGELKEALAAFDAAGIGVVLADEFVAPPTAQYRAVKLYSGLARNLFSANPFLVVNQRSEVLTRLVQQICRERTVDVVHYEWTPLAGGAAKSGTNWVVIAHNIESVIWQRYTENEANLLKRWYIKQQWQKMLRYERWALGAATRSVAVSDTDRQVARAELGVADMAVVENGVDTEFFRPGESQARDPRRFLFLGSLDWRPNLDAVQMILDELLPRLKASLPNVAIDIVGRRAPQWLLDRTRSEPNVQIHSDVPDVRPYLGRCTAMLVPLRIGGGSRLKILEALAMKTPIVSTSVGAEGLDVVHERHLAIADTAEAMAAELLRCVHEPARARGWGAEGRQLVEERYDWRALAQKLERVWQEAASGS